jgi:tetratricopeptide (TPR) repeat protein
MNSRTQRLLFTAREAYERRDYNAALADLRTVAEEHPGFADVRNLMGLCLSMLSRPEDALAEFDRALERNDCYIEALLNRAITLNELGRFDEAREAFDRAGSCEEREESPFPASVSARIANAYLQVGELYMAASAPAEAADEFRRALELRPEFHDIRNRLGEALLQTGSADAAREAFERALEGNDRFLRARLNLGLALYRAGRVDAAREQWEECQRQAPSNPQARAYLRLLEAHSTEHAGDAS